MPRKFRLTRKRKNPCTSKQRQDYLNYINEMQRRLAQGPLEEPDSDEESIRLVLESDSDEEIQNIITNDNSDHEENDKLCSVEKSVNIQGEKLDTNLTIQNVESLQGNPMWQYTESEILDTPTWKTLFNKPQITEKSISKGDDVDNNLIVKGKLNGKVTCTDSARKTVEMPEQNLDANPKILNVESAQGNPTWQYTESEILDAAGITKWKLLTQKPQNTKENSNCFESPTKTYLSPCKNRYKRIRNPTQSESKSKHHERTNWDIEKSMWNWKGKRKSSEIIDLTHEELNTNQSKSPQKRRISTKENELFKARFRAVNRKRPRTYSKPPEASKTSGVTDEILFGEKAQENDEGDEENLLDVSACVDVNEDNEACRQELERSDRSWEDLVASELLSSPPREHPTKTLENKQLEELEPSSDICLDPPRKKQRNSSLKTLGNFADFMQSKQLDRKLTIGDLEEFCLQKITQAIVTCSVESTLRSVIHNQRGEIEGLRSDLQKVRTQVEHLLVINKQLMRKLKMMDDAGTLKEVMPMKIVRSVALQVKISDKRGMNAKVVSLNTSPSTHDTLVDLTVENNQESEQVPNQQLPMIVLPAQLPILREKCRIINKQSDSIPPPPEPEMFVQMENPIVATAILEQCDKPADPVPAKSHKTGFKIILENVMIRRPSSPPKKESPVKIILKEPSDKLSNPEIFRKKQSDILELEEQSDKPPDVLPENTQNFLNNQMKIPVVPKTILVKLSEITPYVIPGESQKPASNLPDTQTSPQLALASKTVINDSRVTLEEQSTSLEPPDSVSNPPDQAHPAPLPKTAQLPLHPDEKPLPPQPELSIKKTQDTIVLRWKLPHDSQVYETIAHYQVYAYQESDKPPSTCMWKLVGVVKAMPLPMACTLSQFTDKTRFYFAVRAMDVLRRVGEFSEPQMVCLRQE